MMDISGSP